MENKRMLDLIKALDNKEEIYIQEQKKTDEEVVTKEFNKFKKILGNSYLRENSIPGQTVTSITNDTNVPAVPGSLSQLGKAQSGLQPQEALEVAIKRTLASGAPVNDLDFYAEVNWNLAGLGFSPQSAVMIKESISAIIAK